MAIQVAGHVAKWGVGAVILEKCEWSRSVAEMMKLHLSALSGNETPEPTKPHQQCDS